MSPPQHSPRTGQRRALVIGSGYLGTRIASLLRDDGWRVTATTTRAERMTEITAPGIEPALLDFHQVNAASLETLAGHDVVLCAAAPGRGGDAGVVYRLGPRAAAARALQAGASRFVLISSTGVYHQSDGSWVNESSPAEPASPREQALRQGELEVLALDGIVLRLGGLYGPGRSPVDWLRRPEMRQRVEAGGAAAWMNWIRVEDAAALAVLAAGTGESGTVYLGVDGHPVRRGDFYARAAELAGAPALELAPSSLDLGKRCDNQRTRNALRFTPRFPSYQTGLAGT